jgi:hypothetical protein
MNSSIIFWSLYHLNILTSYLSFISPLRFREAELEAHTDCLRAKLIPHISILFLLAACELKLHFVFLTKPVRATSACTRIDRAGRTNHTKPHLPGLSSLYPITEPLYTLAICAAFAEHETAAAACHPAHPAATLAHC